MNLTIADIQSLLTIGATGAGIYVALSGLKAWKNELIGRRNIELCQTVIENFYRAEQRFGELRSPYAYPEESKNRQRENGESDAERRLKDLTFVPLARLQEQSEFWSEFFAQKFRMRALFGEIAAQPFDKVDECLRSFRASAVTRYIGIQGDRQVIAGEDLRRLERDIWAGWGEDTIGRVVKEAIEQMEKICIPIVRGRSSRA